MEYNNYLKELQKIASQIAFVLERNFVGFYVTGSFVMNAWNEKTSDIDFIVVTYKPLNEEEIVALVPLHQNFQRSETGKKLEGEYIDLASLQLLDFESLKITNVQNGKLEADSECRLSADNVLCLIQFGKVFIGKPVTELNLFVSQEQYTNALRGMLWEEKMKVIETNNFYELYDVLINTLRCIYGIQTKKLPTKAEAIQHSQKEIGEELYNNIINFRNGNIQQFKLDKNNINYLINCGLAYK